MFSQRHVLPLHFDPYLACHRQVANSKPPIKKHLCLFFNRVSMLTKPFRERLFASTTLQKSKLKFNQNFYYFQIIISRIHVQFCLKKSVDLYSTSFIYIYFFLCPAWYCPAAGQKSPSFPHVMLRSYFRHSFLKVAQEFLVFYLQF